MYGIHFSNKTIEKLIDQNLFTKEEWEADGYTIFDDKDFKYEFVESGNTYTDQFKLFLVVGYDRKNAMENLKECLEYLQTFGLNFFIKDVVKIGGFVG